MIGAQADVFWQTLAAAAALGLACALLSVFVVLRRWALVGEGISHAGFGGAGCAWVLALLLPQLRQMQWLPYVAVMLFSILTALAIGLITRRGRINIDAAIGIFLVASLAWGFLAQQLYMRYAQQNPAAFESLLFGRTQGLSPQFAIAALTTSLAVVLVLLSLGKEILFYALDPTLAQVSGVPVGAIHYLLMVLLALMVILGTPILGSVLVVALLILPGTTALLLSARLQRVLVIATLVGLLGTVGGILLDRHFQVAAGPSIVLCLFVEFIAACIFSRLRRSY